MTSRERLLAAIAHREPDRVPIAPRMHIWAADHCGSYHWLRQLALRDEFDMDPLIGIHFEVPDYITHPFAGDYRDLEDVSVHIEVENQGQVNVVRRRLHTPAGALSDEVVLAHPRSRYGVAPSPSIREPLVKGPEDVDKVRYLLPDPRTVNDPGWREMIEVIGERGLLQMHPRLMMSTLTTAVGMAEAMVAYYQDRALLDGLLSVFGQYFQELTRAMLEHGAPIVFVSWHNLGVSAGWSPAIWREAFRPWIAANVDLVHGYGALYNYFDNGPIAPLLADLAEVGPDILSTLCPPPLGDVDLSEAKRTVGDRICLHGNVDAIHVVQKGTPDQVRQAVREAIRVAAPGGGYILGNSDCFFDSTPRETIEAFFAAAREFGHYPITLR